MKKFSVKFLREFEVEIQADNGDSAAQIASSILAQFPKGSCKLLSIVAEDYIERGCTACEEGTIKPSSGKPPHGNPGGGGSPGTPVVRTEEMVDQVAEAA